MFNWRGGVEIDQEIHSHTLVSQQFQAIITYYKGYLINNLIKGMLHSKILYFIKACVINKIKMKYYAFYQYSDKNKKELPKR